MKKKFNFFNLTFTFKKKFIVTLPGLIIVFISFGQDFNEAPYNESDYGYLMTDRNTPILENKKDSTLVPCRKLTSKPILFGTPKKKKNISGFIDKPFSKLSDTEKALIIDKAWQTKDTFLMQIVLKIVHKENNKEDFDNRICSIRCLSQFNSDTSKKVLISLLNDKECGLTSAFSLVQLGLTEIGLDYIKKHFNEVNDKEDINTALMLINTPDAIKVLKEISEDKDPSNALDALAAMSLLGYCDFAFKGFCKYISYDLWVVRAKVALCLAYYIGTPEAFEKIKTIQDFGKFFGVSIDDLFKIYNIKY